jgi:hypothetical protein
VLRYPAVSAVDADGRPAGPRLLVDDHGDRETAIRWLSTAATDQRAGHRE